MRKTHLVFPTFCFAILFFIHTALADNPLILDQFTADPTARMFEGKIYLYPSHDMLLGRTIRAGGWFAMEDYHVFSTENLIDWTDHGVIVSQDKVDWVNAKPYQMWAPDCVFRDGKYYFYFPAPSKLAGSRGSRIGVAIADKPYGPFKPEAAPIQGVSGIDPCVLIDKDGQAYLYYAGGGFSVAKLKENMVEIADKPKVVRSFPTRGLIEGPFFFQRDGKYYVIYPHVQNKTERLEYAMADNPMGPFTVKGVVMDESASGCWTNQASAVEYKGQWYLFYHDMDLSPDFDKNRAVRADKLTFNDDGTIQKVIPTLRGIGIADAKSKVQIDRYSAISSTGASVSFLDQNNTHLGWKTMFNQKGAWIQYNDVDFGKGDLKSVDVKALSPTGGSIEIHLDKADGPLLARVEIGKDTQWSEVHSKLENVPSEVHNLVVTAGQDGGIEVDWVSFE